MSERTAPGNKARKMSARLRWGITLSAAAVTLAACARGESTQATAPEYSRAQSTGSSAASQPEQEEARAPFRSICGNMTRQSLEGVFSGIDTVSECSPMASTPVEPNDAYGEFVLGESGNQQQLVIYVRPDIVADAASFDTWQTQGQPMAISSSKGSFLAVYMQSEAYASAVTEVDGYQLWAVARQAAGNEHSFDSSPFDRSTMAHILNATIMETYDPALSR